jgi:hypothetical protein
MSGLLIVDEMRQIEERLSINLQNDGQLSAADPRGYYAQFEVAVRVQAAEMAAHYELFYCLEQSIRKLITSTLFDKSGSEWWNVDVPERIRIEVLQRMQREIDSGFSLRSENQIDFTNFGELSVIISANWDNFGAIFSSKRAVERIMNSLNLLRGPIAHCSPLAEDEIERLNLTVKDWFRAMA